MSYPASSFSEAVALTQVSANQIHEVINGESTETINVESGTIPSLRKTLVDNLYFVSPIDWDVGVDETVFNQLRTFTDGTIWWAPTATVSNPVEMTADPYVDSNWTLSIVGNKNYIDETVNAGDSLVAGGLIYPPENRSAVDGNDLTGVSFVKLQGGVFSELTQFPMIKKSDGSTNFSGQLSNINLTTKPYSATVGTDDVWLANNDFFYRTFSTPETFWAVGDGSDETGSMQAAFSYRKVVRLSQGTWAYTGNLGYDTVNDVSVIGDGDQCILKRLDAGSVLNINGCNRINVKDIQTNGVFSFVSGAGGVNLTNCTSFEIVNVYSSSSSRQGINVENGTYGVISGCRVTGSYQDGIMVRNDSRGVTVSNCVTWDNGDKAFGTPIGEGLHFFNAIDCHVVGLYSYDNGDHGLTFEGADYCSATDIISESNVESGCSIADTPERSGVGSEIIGLKARTNGVNGLIVSGVDDLNIIGGYAINNSGYGAVIGVDSGKTQNRIAISSGFKVSGNALGGVLLDWNSIDCSLTGLVMDGTAARGILINRPECVRTKIKDCFVKNFATANITDNGTDSIIKENEGYTTENSGVINFNDTDTSAFVNHGLDYTPSVADITAFVSSATVTNAIGNIRIYNPNSTQFSIGFDNAAGAGGVDITWSVRRL